MCRLLVALAVLLCADASADNWVNEHSVHRTPKLTGEGDKSCLRCHSGEAMRAIAQSVHGNRENPNTPLAKHGCETCHGPGSIHVSRAHGGRGFPPLTEFGRGPRAAPREKQLQACLFCHDHAGTGKKTIVFIGSAHDRGPISCSTCHLAHVAMDPMKDRVQQQETCFRCHRKVKEDHPQVRNRDVNFDRISCGACHKVHKPKAEAP
jgi:DmsE family decaheme c-type cytochrome